MIEIFLLDFSTLLPGLYNTNLFAYKANIYIYTSQLAECVTVELELLELLLPPLSFQLTPLLQHVPQQVELPLLLGVDRLLGGADQLSGLLGCQEPGVGPQLLLEHDDVPPSDTGGVPHLQLSHHPHLPAGRLLEPGQEAGEAGEGGLLGAGQPAA